MSKAIKKSEETKRVFMYNDKATYKYFKDIENACKDAVRKLEVMANVSIGEGAVQNYSEFLENPMEYMTQSYWEKWGSKYNPPHADKYKVFVSSSNIAIADVKEQTEIFVKSVSKLGKKAPSIKKAISFKVKEGDYDVFVAEDKIEEYNATMSLIKAIKKFDKVVGSNDNFHLARWSNRAITTDLKVDVSRFK